MCEKTDQLNRKGIPEIDIMYENLLYFRDEVHLIVEKMCLLSKWFWDNKK